MATAATVVLAGVVGRSSPALLPAVLFAAGLAGWVTETYRERRAAPIAARTKRAPRQSATCLHVQTAACGC